MKPKEFTLKYGKGTISFEIPEDQLLYTIMGKDVNALPDLGEACQYALEHPIDSPPLREIVKQGEKVAIAVSDITRVWQKNDQILPVLIKTLNETGVPDENITIVIAMGGHRQNTEEEFIEICGKEICRRVKVVNHDAWDTKNMVYLGKTSRGTEVSVNKIIKEVDRLILTGGIVYHYLVGYGGGRKSILPGISSIKTIQQNHLFAMGPEPGSGISPQSVPKLTRGNDAHEDMMEIAAFVNPTFIVNVVANLENKIAGIFAGNWVSAWLDATKLVDEICGVEIEEEADIVIATSGGYPMDINLYQSAKTMDNARYAMKKGGVAIIVSECPDISEPADFFQWFDYPSDLEMEKALRENFTIAGWTALKELECHDKGYCILLTKKENAELARKAKFDPVSNMRDALEIAYKKCSVTNPRITVMPQAANTFPIMKTS
ncbi:MAG: nickel-dependent lactate racemase [Deltaproteobacteria bacterium]|nr:nickel-dependent lactate racemase [Deltaproteobacteria bacterium]